MMEAKFLQYSKYYRFITKNNVDYFLIKPNAPLEALLMAKKVNDCYIKIKGYAPALNLDDFDIPETEEPESRDSDSGR